MTDEQHQEPDRLRRLALKTTSNKSPTKGAAPSSPSIPTFSTMRPHRPAESRVEAPDSRCTARSAHRRFDVCKAWVYQLTGDQPQRDRAGRSARLPPYTGNQLREWRETHIGLESAPSVAWPRSIKHDTQKTSRQLRGDFWKRPHESLVRRWEVRWQKPGWRMRRLLTGRISSTANFRSGINTGFPES